MTQQIKFRWQKVIHALSIAGIILFVCLSHFALAQSNDGQETPAITPFSSPITHSEPVQTPPGDEERELLLRQAAQEMFAPHLLPDQTAKVGLAEIIGDWAFVNWRVSSSEAEAEPEWQVYVGLAYWDGLTWSVAQEGSPEFITWLDQIPAELIPVESRPFLKSANPMAANAPGLWLPFPVGQTWKYIAGPNGGPYREAVDFGPFSPGETPNPPPTGGLTGQERDVTAAATGIVIDHGLNFLILRHESAPAWETGYTSLALQSNTIPLWQRVYQGERLGAASAEVDSSKGIHVHFWVRRDGMDQAIAGQLLSDWQVYQDNSFSVGPNSGRIVNRDGQERIDCFTVERLNLNSNLCHVYHASIVPAPPPESDIEFFPNTPLPIGRNQSKTVAVQVNSQANLYAVKLRASYSPTSPVTIVDAWPNDPGLQIAPGSVFSNVPIKIVQNSVNTQTGVIEFEARRQVPASVFVGSGSLISITLKRIDAGPADLKLESVELLDPNEQILPANISTSTLSIIAGSAVEGQVELQGRGYGNGVTVSTVDEQVQTDSAGYFIVGVTGKYRLTVSNPGYLGVQADGDLGEAPLSEATTLNLGRVTLLGGEVTGDNVINILDLAFIAKYYGQRNGLADLNNDGTVNILDLTLTAANYGRQGPITLKP